MGRKDFERLPQQEGQFLALCLASVVLCGVLAVFFAVSTTEPAVSGSVTAPLYQAAVVDLNTADVQALCTLPGVGEKRARAIVDYRVRAGGFGRMSDLLAIPGITPAVLEQWGEQAVLSGADE